MKTSKFISISYLIFLFGGIFVLFLAAKIHSNHEDAINWTWQEKALKSFSIVVAGPGAEFTLKDAQYPRIGLSFQKGDTCLFPSYGIRNDTLFVYSYSGKVKPKVLTIFCSGIKTIVGKENSTILMEQFRDDSLVVKLEKAKFRYFPNNANLNRFSMILLASQSNINIGAANFNMLEVNLKQSQLTGRTMSVHSLSGVLNDHSSLVMGHTNKIRLDADSTSTYHVFK